MTMEMILGLVGVAMLVWLIVTLISPQKGLPFVNGSNAKKRIIGIVIYFVAFLGLSALMGAGGFAPKNENLPCEGAEIVGSFDTNVGALEVIYRVGDNCYISTLENGSYGTPQELTEIKHGSYAEKGNTNVIYKINHDYSLLVYNDDGEKVDEWKKID